MVPPLRDYPLEGTPTNISPLYLGLAGEHQKLNASLAVQACQAWLQQAEKQAEGKEKREGGQPWAAVSFPVINGKSFCVQNLCSALLSDVKV